jgi:hypothetical protein
MDQPQKQTSTAKRPIFITADVVWVSRNMSDAAESPSTVQRKTDTRKMHFDETPRPEPVAVPLSYKRCDQARKCRGQNDELKI